MRSDRRSILMFRPSSSTWRFSSRVPNRVSMSRVSSIFFFMLFGFRDVSPPQAAWDWAHSSSYGRDVGYGDVAYRRTRANPCRRFLHANSWMWKRSGPDCAPRRRGGYQPFEISVARAGAGVNGVRMYVALLAFPLAPERQWRPSTVEELVSGGSCRDDFKWLQCNY